MKHTKILLVMLAIMTTLFFVINAAFAGPRPFDKESEANRFSHPQCADHASKEFDRIVQADGSPAGDWTGNAIEWLETASGDGWMTTADRRSPEVGAVAARQVDSHSYWYEQIVRAGTSDGIEVEAMNELHPNWGKIEHGAASSTDFESNIYKTGSGDLFHKRTGKNIM